MTTEEVSTDPETKKMVHEMKLKRYEELSNETFQNGKMCWMINSIFITAAFVLTAYLLTSQDLPHKYYIIIAILSLLWFSLYYNAGMSKVNLYLHVLMNEIVESEPYKMKTLKDISPNRLRTIYVLDTFIIIYHVIFIGYSYEESEISDTASNGLIILLIILSFILSLYQSKNLSCKISNWVYN